MQFAVSEFFIFIQPVVPIGQKFIMFGISDVLVGLIVHQAVHFV
jgi:hypothetical protein